METIKEKTYVKNFFKAFYWFPLFSKFKFYNSLHGLLRLFTRLHNRKAKLVFENPSICKREPQCPQICTRCWNPYIGFEEKINTYVTDNKNSSFVHYNWIVYIFTCICGNKFSQYSAYNWHKIKHLKWACFCTAL